MLKIGAIKRFTNQSVAIQYRCEKIISRSVRSNVLSLAQSSKECFLLVDSYLILPVYSYCPIHLCWVYT